MTLSFISYAQNFEDLMLWRALKNVPAGFYVDVGAAWPRQDSVTAAFYDRGWKGINIEPNPALYSMLCAERQRDINLNILIGASDEKTTDFFVIEGTGLSTTSKEIADEHLDGGFSNVRVQVEQETLAGIFNKYCQNQDIHFLKVDAEGSEASVLMSNDWLKFRPWICVVEATLPLKSEESYSSWDAYLVSKEYTFVYSDGLNRYYVRKESGALAKFFNAPPNVFDSYETYEVVKLKERIKQLETTLETTLAEQELKAKLENIERAKSAWWRKFSWR